MAKGLRSKSKRANRTALREALTIPIQKKRQEMLAKKLKESLSHSASDSNSIQKLKKILQPKGSEQQQDGDEMNEEEEEIEDEVAEIAKEETPVVQKKKKGSKPRHNPGKELVWFK